MTLRIVGISVFDLFIRLTGSPGEKLYEMSVVREDSLLPGAGQVDSEGGRRGARIELPIESSVGENVSP